MSMGKNLLPQMGAALPTQHPLLLRNGLCVLVLIGECFAIRLRRKVLPAKLAVSDASVCVPLGGALLRRRFRRNVLPAKLACAVATFRAPLGGAFLKVIYAV